MNNPPEEQNANLISDETQQKAIIITCENACDQLWEKFSEANTIKEDVDKAAYAVAKSLFRSGFMGGVKFVSDCFVNMNKK